MWGEKWSTPESKIVKKPVVVSASVHIYNAQTKGIQHESMVKPALNTPQIVQTIPTNATVSNDSNMTF